MFFIIVLLIAILASLFTSKCFYTSEMSLGAKLWLYALFLSAWLAPFYTRALTRNQLFGSFISGWIHNIGYYLFGTAFLLFAVLLLRNLIWFGVYAYGNLTHQAGIEILNPASLTLMRKVNIITVIFTLLLSFYAVYEALKLPAIKEVILETDKISTPFTFVQLSDVHIHEGTVPQRIKELVKTVNALTPDAVFLTGDIGDGDAQTSALAASELKNLKSTYGAFVSLGNHELYRGFQDWEKIFTKNNMTTLNNSGVKLGTSNVFIAGVTDASFSRLNSPALQPNSKKALENASSKNYRILMAHSPLRENKSADPLPDAPFDLQLSGHTHGGQIFPFHFLVKPANKYISGLYPLTENAQIYVSRGTGFWGPPMRLFAPSEITVFKLLPKKANN